MQCLLEVLRAQTGTRAVGIDEWYQMLVLADEHQLLPLVSARLKQSSDILPTEVRRLVCDANRAADLAGFLWSAELANLLRSLHVASVRVIPLKGPSLALRLYGHCGMRCSRDLDLLIQHKDVARAEAVLSQLGFTCVDSHDDYDLKWVRGAIKVELHFNVANPLEFDFHMASAWENSRPGYFQGEPIYLFSPEDELLFLCLHGARHRFERLSLVTDVLFALKTLDLGRKSELSLRPESRHLQPVVDLGRAVALHLDAELSLAGPTQNSERHRKRILRLAGSLWNGLVNETPRKSGWWSTHAFYLQTEPRLICRQRMRLQHIWVLFTRLIEADFAFAARFGWRHPWQVRLLRPVRLMLDRL